MFEIVPFIPAHLRALELQPAQREWAQRVLEDGYAEAMAKGEAWTALVDGKVSCCAGILPQWPGRSIAWANFGLSIPKARWPRVITKIRQVLDDCPARRVETYVGCTHGAGIRLVNLLGFKIEARLAKFAPDGGDCFLYARVRS